MANILVIDDDKDIQRLLQFTLKRAGHTVEASYDGVQGLSQAESLKPDLIVCDVMMPKMTGYEFCRQARTKAALKETPIVIFSARFQPIDKRTALEAGATDYLPKTTDPALLVKRISELLPTAVTQTATAQGIIALFSLRGGAGVTSLAVNLAIALAQLHKSKTTLVDLALLGGHAALMMGLRPTHDLSQLLATHKDNFSGEVVQPYLLQHNSGVQLLAAAPGFHQNLPLADDRLLRLIQSLKTISSLTVLDVPHILEPHFSPTLQLLDKIILLLTPDMPSLQSTAIALQGLVKLGITDDKISLVVNQVMPTNALPFDGLQKALKRPVQVAIPFEAAMTQAINSGKPLLIHSPQSAAAKIIGQLAARIVAIP